MRQSNGTYSGYIYVDEPGPAPTSIDPSKNLCSAASIHFNVTGYNMIYNYIHTKFPGIKFGLTVGYDAVANGGCGANSTRYGPAYIHLAMLDAGLKEDFSSEEEYNACCSTTNPFVADGQKAKFPNVLAMALLYSTSALCQSNGAYPGPAATSGFDIIGAWDVDLYGGWIGPLMDQSFLPNLETYAATGQTASFCEAPTSRVSPGRLDVEYPESEFHCLRQRLLFPKCSDAYTTDRHLSVRGEGWHGRDQWPIGPEHGYDCSVDESDLQRKIEHHCRLDREVQYQ